MLRTRRRARDRRSARALLCAGLSLAAALALAAPLVHAHLAAADTTRDLCGEHHPGSGKADPGGGVCSLCIAGAHAPALREPCAPRPAALTASSGLAVAVHEHERGIPRHRPGTPRAPPHSA